MAPFARALHRWGGRRGVTVAMLRYRFRGWNGDDASPVADGLWALQRIRERYGGVPVVLVGHSMGGRTAFRLAGEPTVVGIVGLAPWLTAAEPVAGTAGRSVLVVHGTADRWTDPAASRAFVAAALEAGATDGAWVPLEGIGHFMLRRPWRWRTLTTSFLDRVLPST
jgi:alpha-beta hydrolase superfamily lysophospholipase